MVKLPKNAKDEIKSLIYQRADRHNYAERSRIENGIFMDELISDPHIGKRLEEFIPRDRIRTYIKDGVLNAYTKERQRQKFVMGPKEIIKKHYSLDTNIIKQDADACLCVSDDGVRFVVCKGTVLKWETAARKALEFISRNETEMRPEILLHLVETRSNMTDADHAQIIKALGMVSIKVSFTK